MRIKDLVKFIIKEDQKKYLIKEIGEDAAELFFRIKDCIEQESGEFLYDGEGVHLTHFLIKESLTDNWSMQRTRTALFKLEKQEYLISRKDHANHGKWYMINHGKMQREVVQKAGNRQLYKLFSRLRVALIILIVLLLVVGIFRFANASYNGRYSVDCIPQELDIIAEIAEMARHDPSMIKHLKENHAR